MKLNFSETHGRKIKKIYTNCCLIFLVAIAVSFAIPKLCYSATYYVDTGGKDSNPGTQAQPWLTLQKAADAVSPGDTVIVNPGTYANGFTLRKSGAPGKYIVFQSAKAHGAYITSSTGFHVGTNTRPASYIKVIGFRTVGGFDVVGDYNLIENNIIEEGTVGISWHPGWPSSTGIIIKGNTFRGKASSNSQKIMVVTGESSVNCLIENNFFDHNTGADLMRIFGTGHIIRNNKVIGLDETGWHSDLFQVYSNNSEQSNNILVENNLFMNCTGSLGMIQNKSKTLEICNWTFRNNVFINIGQVMQVQAPYFKFYNNTFINCGHNTAGPILLRHYYHDQTPEQGAYDWPHDTVIKNNLFIGCGSQPNGDGTGWYHFSDGLSEWTPHMNFDADYNYVTTSKADGYKLKAGFVGKETHGINGGDPKFVNYDGNDFHLRAGSPAIDKGATIAGFNKDKDGNIRPQGAAWDIGAYEFMSSTEKHSLPGPPPNLKLLNP